MNDLNITSEKLETLLREQGVSEFAYSISESEKRELNTELTDVTLYRTVFDNTASVTVVIDGEKGNASCNDLSDTGLRKAVEDAVLGARSSAPDEANVIAEKQESGTFCSGVLEADMDLLYDRLQEMLDMVKNDYPLVNLAQILADHTKTHTVYVNSSGTRFENQNGAYTVMLEMSGSDGKTNTGLDYTAAMTNDLTKPMADMGAFRQHLKDVEASLNITKLPGKFEGTVIFTPDCLEELLGATAQNYLAGQAVLNGTSQWLDKLDQKVASDKITLSLKTDDPRFAMSNPYTADGYRAEDVTIIERGVLKSFLLNLYVAKKTGRPVTKNTGSGMVMECGDKSLEEIIASIDKGLIMGRFSGGRPGANGDFSGVAKNSFYVENGKIVGAVAETMVNGNLGQLLENVVAVSKEQVSNGASVLPYLACSGVVISGK